MSRDWHGELGLFLRDTHVTVTPRLRAPVGRTPPLEVVADESGNLLSDDDEQPLTHLRYPCGAHYCGMPSRRWQQQRLVPWLEEFLPMLGLDAPQAYFLITYARRLPPAPFYDATILTPSQRGRMIGRIDTTPLVPRYEAVFLFQPAFERLKMQAPPPFSVADAERNATLVGGLYKEEKELRAPLPFLTGHASHRATAGAMARSPGSPADR